MSAARRSPRFTRLVVKTTSAALEPLLSVLSVRKDVFWVGERARRELFNDTSVKVGQSRPKRT